MTTTSTTSAITIAPERAAPPGPIPTGRLLTVEFRKTFDTRSGFWLIASIPMLSVLATIGAIVFAPREGLTYESFAVVVGTPMAVILPIIAVLSVTSEWSQRTALTTFTLVPSRSRVVAVKVTVTIAVGVAAMLTALAVGALGNLVGSAIADTDPVWNLDILQVSQVVLAVEIAMLMGFMFGVVLRSSPGAIVGYFVYALVIHGISAALASSQEWWADNGAWFDLNWASGRLYEGTLTGEMWVQLGVTAAIWLLIPLAVGVRSLLKAEIT
jgi:ABC-2 type transport system permease protein